MDNVVILRGKHGTIIVGIILKDLNMILLGSDSRMVTEDGEIYIDQDTEEEFKLEKIEFGRSFGMAMCGDVTLNDKVRLIMKSSTEIYESSQQLAQDFKEKLIKVVNDTPLDERNGLNSGILVGTFDYKNGKLIPKLIHVELTMRGSKPIAHHTYLPEYGFDGGHHEKLLKYLKENYKESLSLKEGIAILKTCLRIVKKTSSDSVSWGRKDTIGGFISVMEIRLASAEERKSGKLIDVNLRNFEEPLVGEEAPTYPKSKGGRKRR